LTQIRTNVPRPGAVDTPIFDEQFPSREGAAEARKQITAIAPLARFGKIACAAPFLASEQSSYDASIDLPVEGSLTVARTEKDFAAPHPATRIAKRQ
jgi:NAD(P)-dependent dehydrogenase (short-subunit alcohol dehydrogenase family)